MLKMYLEYKQDYPESLLFFQVGDFYELFFEDAVVLARTLNLTLTSRDKNSEDPIPMCGVPVSVVDSYIDRIVDLGYSAAVVSQSDQKPTKGMVERTLQRIVTPAVRVHSGVEGGAETGYVAALGLRNFNEFALAYCEVQSGIGFVKEHLNFEELSNFLSRVVPLEILIPRTVDGHEVSRRFSWVREIELRYSERALKFRSSETGSERNFSEIHGYSGLGVDGRAAIRLLLSYVDELTVDKKLVLSEIRSLNEQDTMQIDSKSRTNLELVRTIRQGTRQGSLLDYLDKTCTPGGERLLRNWLLNPLIDATLIMARYDALDFLKEGFFLRVSLREHLDRIGDLERIAARIELGIVSPRELAGLRDALHSVMQLQQTLPEQDDLLKLPENLLQLKSQLMQAPRDLITKLSTLVDQPPLVTHEGGIFRDQANSELDELLLIRRDGKSLISELELLEREKSGISSLKIRYNNVIGYFFEVTKTHAAKVPEHFIRRQSLANGERFTSLELKDREAKILSAREKQIELEKQLFQELKAELLPFTVDIRKLHLAVAELDVLCGLAELASHERLVRPVLLPGKSLFIQEGRHPVLAKQLENHFVPNDLSFGESEARCLILTGPNMGGKSTFLRQAALITIMAQMGSFVPATELRLGLVDKIFARLGASDDMSEGDSTFMVEMREASHILAQATEDSLVLIDELGRGTATADGLAIAQSVLEWLVEKISCRTLFATHFHELTAMAGGLPQVANICVGSIDRDGKVFFTHVIKSGPANKSYGIEVAKLAGLPEQLIQRSQKLLQEMERKSQGQVSPQLDLFLSVRPVESDQRNSTEKLQKTVESIKNELFDFDVNAQTPLQALQKIAELQEKLGEN